MENKLIEINLNELGIEIAEAVRTTGQCEFTAEL